MQLGKLGTALKNTGDAQLVYTNNCRDLIDEVTALVEVNKKLQDSLEKVMERQVHFSQELNEQKEKLAVTCDELSDEISNQLYAFDRMRSLYEK